jgi:hypothetical protein
MVVIYGPGTRPPFASRPSARSYNRAELEVRKLLANAPLPARSKGLVPAVGALRDRAGPEVDLLVVLIVVLCGRLGCDALEIGSPR